jgi:tetratricopeptide (TPR) repeat protein
MPGFSMHACLVSADSTLAPARRPELGSWYPARAGGDRLAQTGRLDYVAIAEQAARPGNPLLALEFHPAAVLALDAFFDLNWGDAGEAPGDDAWRPGTGKWNVIVNFGSFFGELLRREFGGEWQHDASQLDNALAAHVALPGGVQAFPLSYTYKRLRDGGSHRFEPYHAQLRAHYRKRPSPDELDGWLRQGRHFEGVGRPDLAQPFYARALALELAPDKRSEVEAAAAKVREAAEREAAEEPKPKAEPRIEPKADLDSALAPGETADAHLMRGAALFSKGQHEPALAAFEWALALDPGRAAALLGKARALVALQRFPEAAAWLEAFVGRADCEPERSYLAAGAALATGDKPKAHELYSRVAASPRLLPASREQAQRQVAELLADPAVAMEAALRLDAMADVVEALGRICYSHPEFAPAWRERGVGLSMLGRSAEAVTSLQRAQQLEPAVSASYDHEAVVLARDARHQEAIEALERGLGHAPSSGVLLMRKGVFLTVLGRNDEAARAFDAAIAAEPTYLESWAFKGDLEQKLGHTEQAIASLERYLAGKPGSQEKRVLAARRQLFGLRNPGRVPDRELALHALDAARVKLDAGALAEALPLFEDAVKADPLHAEAWQGRGTCLMQLARPQEAAACYREAEALVGPTPQVANALATALVRLERGQEAVEVYDRALAASGGHADTLLAKARTLVRLGRTAEALAVFDRLVARAPSDGALVRERADVLGALGRSVEAVAAYERTLELVPGDAVAQQARAAFIAGRDRSAGL